MDTMAATPATETMTADAAVDVLIDLAREIGGRLGRRVRVRGAVVTADAGVGRVGVLGAIEVDHDGQDRAAVVTAVRQPGGMARLRCEAHDGDSRGAVWRTVTLAEAVGVMRRLTTA